MIEDVEVPEGWRRVRLGEIIEIFDRERIPLDSEYRVTIKGSFPYCGATGVIDYINDYIFDGGFKQSFFNVFYQFSGH
jgi:type I restriction enzyme S subunit